MSSASPRDEQPLTMTVHTMPDLAEMQKNPVVRTRMGRWKMLLVLLVCAAPVIASYFTYYVIRPEGRKNFGQLIDPQRPLPNVTGTTLQGAKVNLRSLKGQWLLVSVDSGACDALCTSNLYLQRQLRQGLGKEKDRLDWVWLVDDALPVSDALQSVVQQAVVIRMPKAQIAAWLQPQAGLDLSEHLYLVDPLGNWMMRFPPRLGATMAPNVKRDLNQVLRASSFWDNAGR